MRIKCELIYGMWDWVVTKKIREVMLKTNSNRKMVNEIQLVRWQRQSVSRKTSVIRARIFNAGAINVVNTPYKAPCNVKIFDKID